MRVIGFITGATRYLAGRCLVTKGGNFSINTHVPVHGHTVSILVYRSDRNGD